MIHLLQTQYIARMNQLHSLQQEIALFENSGNYQKTIHAYKKYVDFVRSWQNSNALINAYLQMAKYCERMEDRSYGIRSLFRSRRIDGSFRNG